LITEFTASDGQTYRTQAELNRGGEGIILTVAGRPDVVVKPCRWVARGGDAPRLPPPSASWRSWSWAPSWVPRCTGSGTTPRPA